MANAKENVSKALLEIGAVTLSPQKPYKWVSGLLSPIYCDNRLILSYPEKRELIVDSFVALIKREKLTFDVLAGVATSGIPHAALIADRLEKPMIYVRADAKQHGKGNIIEGKLEPGQKVLVVEDLISTGKSSLAAVVAVRNAGGIVTDCVAIFTYGLPIAKEQFEANECALHTLSDFATLILVASSHDYLSKDGVENVLRWNKDPQNWGR